MSITSKPLYAALSAVAYIALVVGVVFTLPSLFQSGEESIFMPILMLSMLVLSVAVMAFLFFYQPLVLILDGKRDAGIRHFLETLGFFVGLTALVLTTAILLPF